MSTYMNTYGINKMCREIYRDYCGMGRTETSYDADIYNIIMRLYNTIPEIDWEEVKFLWVTFLESGNLEISTAITMGRKRGKQYV